MTKIQIIFIGVTLAMVMGVARGGSLSNIGPIPLFAEVAGITEPIQEIDIAPLNDSIGTVALPLNTLCNTVLVYDYFTCFVCNQDCIWAHNTYGGLCDVNPNNPTRKTCRCAFTKADAERRNIYRSSGEMCRRFEPSLLEIKQVGYLLDYTYALVLQARAGLGLCPERTDGSGTYESSGCKTDCIYNHGMTTGTCMRAAPVITELGTAENLYCVCS